jgi:hypothetical protein
MRDIGPWQRGSRAHERRRGSGPGILVADPQAALSLGGDYLTDVVVPPGRPEVLGAVASSPTVLRLLTKLAADAPWVPKTSGRAGSRGGGRGHWLAMLLAER